MKIYQRYQNCGKQKIPKHKIQEKYKNQVQHLIEDTQLSFDSIKTPGWTSLVNTEQSKEVKSNFLKFMNQKQKLNNHNQILNRLNSIQKFDTNKPVYQRIRISNSSLTKNKNIFIYSSTNLQRKKEKQILNSNRFLNRFSEKKSNQNLQILRNAHSSKKSSPRIRIVSVKSQPNQKLKDLISQRISMGNNQKKQNIVVPEFESGLTTQQNQFNNTIKQNYSQIPTFYSKIHINNFKNHSNSIKKNQNGNYLNKYLRKIHQRSQSCQNKNFLIKKSQFQPQIKQKTKNPSCPRFNTINVYEHLYRDSIKLQSKKNMAKIIDQSYQKATILTFTPQISNKSNILVQSKFTKQNKDIQNFQKVNIHKKCYDKYQISQLAKEHLSNRNELKVNIFPIQQKITIKQKEKMKEKIQNRTLMRLFYVLSNESELINEKTLEQNIEKLPLSFLQILQPFLTRVYQKIGYNMNKFLQIFSNEQTMKLNLKKHLIINQTQKLLRVIHKEKKLNKENDDKFLNK